MNFDPTKFDRFPLKERIVMRAQHGDRFEDGKYYIVDDRDDQIVKIEFMKLGVNIFKFNDGRGSNNIFGISDLNSLEMAARMGAIFVPSRQHFPSVMPAESKLPEENRVILRPGVSGSINIAQKLREMNINDFHVNDSHSVTLTNPVQIAAVAVAGAPIQGCASLIETYFPEKSKV